MSKFLSSFEADPEQRFNKAAVHLRTLVFGRLSDDHVVALALLHELGGIYRRAYGTDQVLKSSARRETQEEALAAHLRALGLPCEVAGLEFYELEALVTTWQTRWQTLPRPFDKTLQTFVLYAETQLNTVFTQSSTLDYQAR